VTQGLRGAVELLRSLAGGGVEGDKGDLKKAVESENVEDIKQKISDARQVSMKIGEALMKNQASGTAGTGFDGGQAAEAEYEDVKGKK
jgi:hypothetical protein